MTQALAALRGGGLTSVSLSGDAVWTAGSYAETGTITLEAAAGGYSRVDLELGGGSRSTVRAPLSEHTGAPPGGAARATGTLAAGAGPEAAVRKMPSGAAWTPAAWFFPSLALQTAAAPGATATNPGPGKVHGAVADHLRLCLTLTKQSPNVAAEVASLSQADYFLDPVTRLPLALDFVEHPSGIVNRGGVRVEIRYSDWRVRTPDTQCPTTSNAGSMARGNS